MISFVGALNPFVSSRLSLLKTTTCNQFVIDLTYFYWAKLFVGPWSFGPQGLRTEVVDARHGTQTAMAVGWDPQERSSYLMREVVRCHPNVWVGFGMSKLDCASRESFPKWFGGYAFCHRFLPTVTTSVGLLIQIQRNSSFLAKNPSTFPHQRCLLRLPSDSQH